LEEEMQRLRKSDKQKEDVILTIQQELLDHKQKLLSFTKNENKEAQTSQANFHIYTELLKNPSVIGPDREYVEKAFASYKLEETRKISALEEQVEQLKAQIQNGVLSITKKLRRELSYA
jgi:anti-sigma28 factor (negative regulator of flagellin synthesis)